MSADPMRGSWEMIFILATKKSGRVLLRLAINGLGRDAPGRGAFVRMLSSTLMAVYGEPGRIFSGIPGGTETPAASDQPAYGALPKKLNGPTTLRRRCSRRGRH